MRIVLSGAKASGKSTIGNALAGHLGVDFIDLDDVILNLARSSSIDAPSCADIYRSHGEALFRRLEQKAILEIRHQRRCVLSTGGSTLMYPLSRHRLRKDAVWIFLNASWDVLWDRLSFNIIPAYLEGSASPATAFSERVSLIRKTVMPLCDHLVDVESRSPDEIVADIVSQLNQKSPSTSNVAIAKR